MTNEMATANWGNSWIARGQGKKVGNMTALFKKKVWINYCVYLNSCQLEARNRLERCFQRMLCSHSALTVLLRCPVDYLMPNDFCLTFEPITDLSRQPMGVLLPELLFTLQEGELCRRLGPGAMWPCWEPWRCCGRCLKILRHGLGCSGSFIISSAF